MAGEKSNVCRQISVKRNPVKGWIQKAVPNNQKATWLYSGDLGLGANKLMILGERRRAILREPAATGFVAGMVGAEARAGVGVGMGMGAGVAVGCTVGEGTFAFFCGIFRALSTSHTVS